MVGLFDLPTLTGVFGNGPQFLLQIPQGTFKVGWRNPLARLPALHGGFLDGELGGKAYLRQAVPGAEGFDVPGPVRHFASIWTVSIHASSPGAEASRGARFFSQIRRSTAGLQIDNTAGASGTLIKDIDVPRHLCDRDTSRLERCAGGLC